jgi:hypothetical protein
MPRRDEGGNIQYREFTVRSGGASELSVLG